MNELSRDLGSFRDPSSQVFLGPNTVLRRIRGAQVAQTKKFLASDFYRIGAGKDFVETTEVSEGQKERLGIKNQSESEEWFWLEHEFIDLITYPYEWTFGRYQQAAVFHLEVLASALRHGFITKDASPYNIQFKSQKPCFIDIPSFVPYRDNQPWLGYKQYCEMFLNPLVLQSITNAPTQLWLKGTIEGIDSVTCSRLLPKRTWLNFSILAHVHLHARAIMGTYSHSKNASNKSNNVIPKRNLIALIEGMKNFISKLKHPSATYWSDYEGDNSYSDLQTREKDKLIGEFATKNSGKTILDLGCNAGRHSEILLSGGAARVIGIDIDANALEKAENRPSLKNAAFTCIRFDFANPSPNLGWLLSERKSLEDRLPPCDALVCLALVHHLAIGKNLPLREVVEKIIRYAPVGIIEFPTKDDPMVKGLLLNREDVFDDYNPSDFEQYFPANILLNRLPYQHPSRIFYEYKTLA